jgi:pimeloyl-ACP methyl ester carboxylesterase
VTVATDPFPRISTRDHFWVTWFNGEKLTDGHTATGYQLVGDPIPGTGNAKPPKKELLVHVHGFMNDDASAVRLFKRMQESLGDASYDGDVVGFTWDSNWNPNRWWSTVRIARRNGRKLAAFIQDYRTDNPNTPIRLTAHSLGAQVAVSTLEALREQGERNAIESVSLLGGAVRATDVARDGAYCDAIEQVPGQVRNYHSEHDWVLWGAFGPAEFASAVGLTGVQGEEPDGYADRDVSDRVNSHFDYVRPRVGCIDRVVADFQ